MSIPGYDAWLTAEPEPDVLCFDCGGPIRGMYSWPRPLCKTCYAERRAAARGED